MRVFDTRLRSLRRVGLAMLLAGTALPSARAEKAANSELSTVDVWGASPAEELVQSNIEALRISNETGTLVGLTPFETPAAIDIVTQQEMQERGLRTLTEVFNAVPGVMSGNLPGEPGVTSIRGFSRGAVGYMLDGMSVPDPLFMTRNYDSFTFERVEVLKGPASVISGNGALAGTINLVTKQPILGQNAGQALLSYGSFDTLRAGADYNVALGENAAVRASAVYSRSNGYVDDTQSETAAVTLGATVALSDRLTSTSSIDYFHDDYQTPYQGTPLIARSAAISPSSLVSAPGGLVIDRALRDRNYNVDNGEMTSDAVWLRNRTAYELTDTWTLRNDVGYLKADRRWANSEDFTYNAATGLLDRTTALITHDQEVFYDQVSARFDGTLAGMRHRFAAGLEYIDTGFATERRFGATTPVSPYFPVRGYFPADTAANFPSRQNHDSTVRTLAAFAEDAVNLTDQWLVIGGIRYENISLDRSILNLNTRAVTSFGNDYQSLSWRLGTVYEIVPGTALFAQYNQATVPVSSLLTSNLANVSFELSTGQSAEVGIKSTFWNNRAVATASIYQIEQDDILTRDPSNPTLTVQGGSMRSRGAEAELAVAVTDQLKLTANASYIHAEFTELWSAGGNLAGRRPPNVPQWTAFLMADYKVPDLPLTLSASVQYVGAFYTDNANTIEVAGHTVLDAWISWELGPGTLRLRGRNLTNAFYADWSGYSPTQVFLGAPRSVELSYAARF